MLEALSHRTPPTCITPNILTWASIIVPSMNIVRQLWSVNFVRDCRSVLVFLLRHWLLIHWRSLISLISFFSDGTDRRQIKIENAIVGYLSDKGYRTITLATDIIAERGTGEGLRDAAMLAFKQGRNLLREWRDCTARMFPGRADLLSLLPDASQLCVSKFRHGAGVMTDGCGAARKFRRLFIASVKEVCAAKGYSADDTTLFEHDCWQHMRNVWFGAVLAHLSKFLGEIMADDLTALPAILRMTTEIEDLLRCIEKTFGATAQYAKGCGAMFMEWMQIFHIGVYYYPVARALGGNRQDLGLYGAPAVLMNLKYYLEFLNWQLLMGTSTCNILF